MAVRKSGKTTDIVTKIVPLPGEQFVTMSNALIRAGQGLTLSEKRLMMAAVACLDSKTALRRGDCPEVRISAMEYAETFGVNLDTAYDQLKSAAAKLYNRSIQFFEPDYKRQRKGEPMKVTVQMRWVGSVKYHEKEGWIELHFWHQIVPFLTGLKKQFTSYKLQQASSLRSIYSWRLLELLLRFESSGWAEYTVEDFGKSMDATPKQMANFAKIRTKIIEPAVAELTEKDNWLIQWSTVKAGRKVVRLRFDFQRNPQGRLF